MRLRPSNRNGLVTMPIVSAPRSRAIWEMIGAAPVPVPPPMPHVTKTRSAPCSACSTSSRFSSIAWRPISGRAPAPRPRVSFLPICTLTSALLLRSAWASVFTEMNSTPLTCSSIIRFRALPPPLHAVDQSGDPELRMSGAHRRRKDFTRQLHHARQMGRAAREHDARGQPVAVVSRPLELAAHELEDLVHPLVNDVRHQLPGRG